MTISYHQTLQFSDNSAIFTVDDFRLLLGGPRDLETATRKASRNYAAGVRYDGFLPIILHNWYANSGSSPRL
jgi:hypothetical protein